MVAEYGPYVLGTGKTNKTSNNSTIVKHVNLPPLIDKYAYFVIV